MRDLPRDIGLLNARGWLSASGNSIRTGKKSYGHLACITVAHSHAILIFLFDNVACNRHPNQANMKFANKPDLLIKAAVMCVWGGEENALKKGQGTFTL